MANSESVTGACVESLDLANALGINVNGLTGFTLNVNAGSFMTVQATYEVTKGKIQTVIELLQVSHAAMRKPKAPTSPQLPS